MNLSSDSSNRPAVRSNRWVVILHNDSNRVLNTAVRSNRRVTRLYDDKNEVSAIEHR